MSNDEMKAAVEAAWKGTRPFTDLEARYFLTLLKENEMLRTALHELMLRENRRKKK